MRFRAFVWGQMWVKILAAAISFAPISLRDVFSTLDPDGGPSCQYQGSFDSISLQVNPPTHHDTRVRNYVVVLMGNSY